MHAAFTPREWESLFVATLGAAAALAGLLFVALSINLARIMSFQSLPGRAGETIAMLLEALIVSALVLVPGQSPRTLGIELLVLGIVGWAVPVRLQLGTRQATDPGRTYLILRVAYVQAGTLPVVVGAISLIAGGGGGLYWIGLGVLLLFVASVWNAWVLLVEILR
ncbi:MAG TPA: hypothetical protein VEM41_04965 [Actinomycetota bacterium]|nr:hypothetical protein [Actinomycetota bacterium]